VLYQLKNVDGLNESGASAAGRLQLGDAVEDQTRLFAQSHGPLFRASTTKVSKPVLFALKMTDLQDPHKKDSPFVAGGPGSASPRAGGALI
jgi:hypothetical protein